MCRHDHRSGLSFEDRNRLAEKLVAQVQTAATLYGLGGDFENQAVGYVVDAQAKAEGIDLGSTNRVSVLNAAADFYVKTVRNSEASVALVTALDILKGSIALPEGTRQAAGDGGDAA